MLVTFCGDLPTTPRSLAGRGDYSTSGNSSRSGPKGEGTHPYPSWPREGACPHPRFASSK